MVAFMVVTIVWLPFLNGVIDSQDHAHPNTAFLSHLIYLGTLCSAFSSDICAGENFFVCVKKIKCLDFPSQSFSVLHTLRKGLLFPYQFFHLGLS